MITTIRTVTREARPRRRISILLWAAQIVLAAMFLLAAAAPKLAGSHASVQEFGLIGAGQWFRYFVGIVELAGAIGLLTPWLGGLAAVGLAADMTVATIVNATVLRNTTFGPNVGRRLCWAWCSFSSRSAGGSRSRASRQPSVSRSATHPPFRSH